MAKFEKHIFICTNQRPDGNPRGCCNPSGEAELHRAFKEKLRERGIPGDKVRANKAGCLEQCEVGPTVVVYPDAVWYGGVTPADVDEIIDSHIIGGQPGRAPDHSGFRLEQHAEKSLGPYFTRQPDTSESQLIESAKSACVVEQASACEILVHES